MSYTHPVMEKITKEEAIKRWKEDKEVYLLYPDNTEGAAMSLQEIKDFEWEFGYERY